MGILGNMQVLSFLSRILTLLTYQNGYYECDGSQRYHYGRRAMLKLVFVAPKFRLRRVKKKGKLIKNEKNAFCKKKLLFLRVHELGIVLGVNMDRKNHVGKVTFRQQLRRTCVTIYVVMHHLRSRVRILLSHHSGCNFNFSIRASKLV